MPKLMIKLGDGLKFDSQSKISVDVSGDNITIDSNGLYVSNLDGAAGSGGTVPDGWTTVNGVGINTSDPSNPLDENSFIDINRDVVNIIYTFGLYKPTNRHATTIDYSSTVKDVRAICNEIVAPCYYDPQRGLTSYQPRKGEMIQLVTNPQFRASPFSSGTIAVESGNRFGDDTMETKVILVITEIVYMSDISQTGSQYWVYSMKLRCIYSEVQDYVVGDLYTGTQYIDGSNYV